MDIHVRDMLRTLAGIQPQPVPAGEAGVTLAGASDGARYIPMLSVYLDWRPEATGERPGIRAARVALKERLRQIERAFWPRGAAYDAIRADAARIQRYLDEQAAPSAEGLAIFACAPLGLFETLESGVPFETEVTARATPNLYPLARLLDDQETAIVAVVDTNTARLFVSQRGLLREMKGLDEDPKYFHMMKGATAMNQAHYERYALAQRKRFAVEVAQRLSELVDETGAKQVIIAGDAVATPILKASLAPQVTALLHEIALPMAIDATRDEIWEEVEPMVREAEAEEDRSVVELLLDQALSGHLGVLGLERTRAALETGQVDTLVLLADLQAPPETRSQLISLATRTGAEVEIVDDSPELAKLGGVGALLRFKLGAASGGLIVPTPEAHNSQPTA
ncbi:MAG TPA: hypothetical protein VF812_09965 [Ktedonobacterales bacterium]